MYFAISTYISLGISHRLEGVKGVPKEPIIMNKPEVAILAIKNANIPQIAANSVAVLELSGPHFEG